MGIDHIVAGEQIAPSAQLVQRERKQRCRPGGTQVILEGSYSSLPLPALRRK